MKPTKAELNKLIEMQRALTSMTDGLMKYHEELAKTCEHPKEMVEDTKWEHDDGYGRQTMITGKWCRVCWKTDRWKNGNFS